MSRSGSKRSIAPISPSRPYETRSPSSTCDGSPEPSRPATYLTSGAYVRISRSRSGLFFVRANSLQSAWISVSAATVLPEYELAATSPHRRRDEGRHPGRERACCDRDRPLTGERARNRDAAERERDHREQRRERHAARLLSAAAKGAAEPRVQSRRPNRGA